jgi:hypothetical protein
MGTLRRYLSMRIQQGLHSMIIRATMRQPGELEDLYGRVVAKEGYL